MNQKIISPKEFNLAPINKSVILIINLEHFYQFHRLVEGTKIKSFGPSKKFNFEIGNRIISVIGGMIGAPLAIITAENAISSGGVDFVCFGTVGSIAKDPIQPGTCISPKMGYDKTGILKDYGSDQKQMDFITTEDFFKPVNLISLNSIYQLDIEMIKEFQNSDIGLMDMEITALGYVITKKANSFRPLLIVSDYIDKNYSWVNSYSTENFKSGIEKGLKYLKFIFNT